MSQEIAGLETTAPPRATRFATPTFERVCVALIGIAAASLLVSFRGLARLGERIHTELQGGEEFFFEPTGSSPTFVFVLAAWLFSRRWRRFRASIGQPAWPVAGVIGVLGGGVVAVWSHWVGVPELSLPALVLVLFGSAFLLGGRAAAVAIRMPALFLLLALPIPGIVLNQLIYPLQLATATGTAAVLNSVGLETQQSGDLLFQGGRAFQVIEACSGLRGIQTLLMSAFLYLELFPRSRTRSILLIVLTPLLGMLINLARVISIVLNPYSQVSAVHTLQGVLMLAGGVLMLAALDRLLGSLLRDPPPGPVRHPPAQFSGSSVRRAAFVALLTALLAMTTVLVPPWNPRPAQQTVLAHFPSVLGGWRAEGLSIDRQFLGSVAFDEWIHRKYVRGTDAVELLLIADRRLDPRRSLLSPKLPLIGPGWWVEAEVPGDAASGVRRHVIRGVTGRRLVETHYLQAGSPFQEALYALFALDRSPLRRPDRLVAVRISTPMDPHEASFSQAARRLEDFRAAMSGPLAQVLAPVPTSARD